MKLSAAIIASAALHFGQQAHAAPSLTQLNATIGLGKEIDGLMLDLSRPDVQDSDGLPSYCRQQYILQTALLSGTVGAIPQILAMRVIATGADHPERLDEVVRLALTKALGEIVIYRERVVELNARCSLNPGLARAGINVLRMSTKAEAVLSEISQGR